MKTTLSRTLRRIQLVSFATIITFTGLTIIPRTESASASPVTGPVGELLIPEVSNDTVAVMDTATNKITKRYPMRVPVGPTRPAVLAKSADENKIYVDNFGALYPSIGIINRKKGTSRTMRVESVPLGIFSSSDGKEIYIPEVGFVVEVLDVATDKIVRRLRFPDSPAGAMEGPDGLMYVGFVSGLIGAYNPKTGAMVKRPIWSGGLANFWYTFSKDGKKLYTDSINSIGIIDLKKWKLIKTLSTRVDGKRDLMNPGAFTSELSPDGSKLYVTRFGMNGVLVISTKTEKLLRVIPTQGDVIGLTFSKDGTRGYIADCGRTTRFKFLPPYFNETLTFTNLITVGWLGKGRLLTFDPTSDRILDTTQTEEGPGVPLWVSKQ